MKFTVLKTMLKSLPSSHSREGVVTTVVGLPRRLRYAFSKKINL